MQRILMNRPLLGCALRRTSSTALRSVGGLLLTLVAFAGGLCSGSLARADDSASVAEAPGLPEPDQWMIYGGPEIAIYAQTGKGNTSGTEITGPRVDPPCPGCGDLGTAVVDPIRSRETISSFLAGATFGVLTPALDLPGKPRAFVDINISSAQTIETSLARTGNPGVLAFPSEGRSFLPIGENAMAGGGTQMSVQQQGPQIHAGLGVSFEFPISTTEMIRIKPAIVYSRTIAEIEGLAVRPVRLNDDSGDDQQLDDFRVINLAAQFTKVYHSSGPSLEVEYFPDIKWGPLTLSVYGRAHASYSFTSPKTILQQCNTAGGQPGECVQWKYTQDRWAYRATLGVHVNWVPRALW